MAGVTSSGFEAKRLADVEEDAAEQLRTVVDPASGESLEPDFGSEDPAMQVVHVPLEGVGLAWEAAQLIYQQFDPKAATGPSQSNLVQLNGITRQDASPSTVTLQLTGTPATVIAAGQLASDVNNVNQWSTLADVELDGSGVGSVQAACLVVGPTVADVGTIINIVTPFPGWTGVTNLAAATPGRNVETDTELRQRRDRSTMAPAASPVESVYANLANITGVTYARVRQNNTLAVDSNGIPGKSVAAVVVGGEDLDIAYTLLARTGIASAWFGNTSQVLFDEQGEPYTVSWTRPTPLPVYVELELEIVNPNIFPADGLQQIKDAIRAYAQGGAPALGIDDGFSTSGFPPGATVLWSRLFTPINFIPGHRVVSLFIGTSPNPTGTADIPTPWDQVPLFLDENIDITVI